MKKLAIIQSSYIPWKGYFDVINMVDEFMFLDDVQYTYRDWRVRNKIITQSGPKWITIPAGKDRNRLICEVELTDVSWQLEHWNKIEQNYLKAPFYNQFRDYIAYFYLEQQWRNLSDFNQTFIKSFSSDILQIKTKFTDSRQYNVHSSKSDRILDLCVAAGASDYLSGPKAKDYLKIGDFDEVGISVTWMNYEGYPKYKQLYDGFEHGVSIIDLLFNVGDRIEDYMLSFA